MVSNLDDLSMTTVSEHYAKHLGPIYVWMAGGFEEALSRGQAEVVSLGLKKSHMGFAVDLGAGFGMHTIPLARLGYSVLAVDSSRTLLACLQSQVGTLPIRTVEGDLLEFADYLAGKIDVILCMGDTLTHLLDVQAVERLITAAARSLKEGGRLVMSFRDYSVPLRDENRFVPVRSDSQRVMTCFLEYFDSYVQVHDLLYEKADDGWAFRASAYKKIRLAPEWVIATLESTGFVVRRETGLSGMLRLNATLA